MPIVFFGTVSGSLLVNALAVAQPNLKYMNLAAKELKVKKNELTLGSIILVNDECLIIVDRLYTNAYSQLSMTVLRNCLLNINSIFEQICHLNNKLSLPLQSIIKNIINANATSTLLTSTAITTTTAAAAAADAATATAATTTTTNKTKITEQTCKVVEPNNIKIYLPPLFNIIQYNALIQADLINKNYELEFV